MVHFSFACLRLSLTIQSLFIFELHLTLFMDEMMVFLFLPKYIYEIATNFKMLGYLSSVVPHKNNWSLAFLWFTRKV